MPFYPCGQSQQNKQISGWTAPSILSGIGQTKDDGALIFVLYQGGDAPAGQLSYATNSNYQYGDLRKPTKKKWKCILSGYYFVMNK